MPFKALADLPSDVLGENGRPAVLLAPIETSDHGLPTLTEQSVTRLKVFRTGAVKDSKGRKRVWSREDLEQMVANFALLRDKGLLPNVPVRENHSRDVRQIGGYITGLHLATSPAADGRFYLEADLDLTEPDVRDRYNRGTYRNRSIEIGAYESNDGDIYFPVVLGLAFCDIPAVEGLYEAALSAYENDEQPEIMVYAPDNGADASGNTPAGNAPQTDATFDKVIQDLNAVMAGLENPDAQNAVQKVIQAVEALKGATAQQPAAPAPTNAQGEQMPETFKFALDGTEHEIAGDDATKALFTTLLSQRDALATENAEFKQAAEKAAEKAREAAVDGWLHAKKIVPAQVDGMKAYVKTLTDEQFTAHAALIEGTPVLNFTQEPDAGSTEGGAPGKDEQVKNHEQTLTMLKYTGMGEDALKNSRPYKALVALGVTPNLEA